MRYTARDKYETRLHRVETIQELMATAHDDGMKEGLIGQIHLCQRLLAQPETSTDVLRQSTAEHLHARAEALEMAILDEREEKRQPLTAEQRERLFTRERYVRDTHSDMTEYRVPAEAMIRKAKTLLALYIRVWRFELNWLQSEYRRPVATVAELETLGIEALQEIADVVEREVLTELGCTEEFYLNWKKRSQEETLSHRS